jgi:hypothetical protein
MWIVFFFYNGPTPPQEVFANFTKVASILDTTKTRSFHDLVTFNNNFVVHNSIYTIATETMPLPNATVGKEVMKGIYDTWHNLATSVQNVPGVVASIAFQPLHKTINTRTKEFGGTILEYDDSVDRIILELDYSYWYPTDDEKIDIATVKSYTSLGDKVREYIKAGKLPDAHTPLFMNDAYSKQDYWGRLRSKDKWLHVREKFDPAGFWKKRTKGFQL